MVGCPVGCEIPLLSAALAGYEAGMTLFQCRECGKELTGVLSLLSAVPKAPARNPDQETTEDRRAPATMPRGYYAVETEPWGPPFIPAETDGPAYPRGPWMDDERGSLTSAGPRGNFVLHPDDAGELILLSSTGLACCGPSPSGGMNQACPCGVLVATLAADCWGPYELHLVADKVQEVHTD